MAFKPDDYSLADFYLSDLDSVDPTVPPPDFTAWRRETTWASQLYEPTLRTAPTPRIELAMADVNRPEINLTSYNYLGLGTHPEVVAAAAAALQEFGTGACGSPLLSGKTTLHAELERQLARFLQREAVMLFNSGFSGALGSLAGLLRKDDVAVVDSKSHVSLVDGAKLSGAKVLAFEHNNPGDLDRALAKSAGKRRLVVVEGVYSMDGDKSRLAEVVAVAEQHGAPVLVDEAHSILTCGASGRGMVEESGMESRVRLQYGTFSKAFAGIGGFVAGPADTIDYLRCYASSYGFSCALPAATVAGLLAALRVANAHPERRAQLWANADYFRTQAQMIGLNTGESETYVVPLVVGQRRGLLYELGNELRRRGLFLAPVDYPSVPQDQVRFRASVTAEHTRADLDEALNILEDVMVPALRAQP